MKEQIRDIRSGPDKFLMMVSLLQGNQKEQPAVRFTVKVPYESPTWEEYIKIDSIQREDGSGESWNIDGWNVANNCRVQIYYDTRSRQGRMTFMA